jgi:glutamate 5-kinase
MCGADYLFLLTDVEGLYEDNPRKVPGARRVTIVRDIEEVRKMGASLSFESALRFASSPLALSSQSARQH